MKVIKPKRIIIGDTIGIISPASTPDDLSRIEKSINYLERLGYRTEVGENVGKIRGYLAGTDEERTNDIHQMFKNKKIKAVFSLRGGYGSPRLLDKLDYNLIKKNPKIFVGYSDITALNLAFFKKAGLITFAGPMLAVDFWNEVEPFTEENFWSVITSNKKIGRVNQPQNEKIFSITKGNAVGRIVGGNLAVLSAMLGTHYIPDFKDKILLLEDIGEQPYRIDRMLSHLKLSSVFRKLRGIILGIFSDCIENDPTKRSLSIGEIMEDYLAKLKFPVVYNFRHGHLKENLTVPIGINSKINAIRGFIEFTESAVV